MCIKGPGKIYTMMCYCRIYRAELVVGVTLLGCLGGTVLLKISNGDLSIPLEDTAGSFRVVLALRF